MPIRLYKESDHDDWDKYVLTSAGTSAYHLIGWKRVIEKSFGHKTYYLLSQAANGQINGLAPLVHLNSIFFGNFAVSLPYFNYGGIHADTPDLYNELLQELIRIARDQKMNHMELRYDTSFSTGLQVKTAKASMRLTLPRDKEELWKTFPSKLRSQVQRPIKEKMYARLGRQDELENFYSVFSVNMRDLGTPVYSERFFENILREFPDNTWICTVFSEQDQPVASGFLLGFQGTMEIPWASSLREFNRYSPNMLLYWTVLGFACEQGYGLFDFGRSTPGEGTYRFKEQWGARPTQLYWHYWIKNGGPMPEINPHNPKYKTAIKIWQKLPLGLTKLIGPHIVKSLP